MAERIVIIKNTVTGQDLTMPVTPKTYPVASGRAVERLDMGQTGQIALPGLKSLFNETLEVMFPAQLYPFCTAGAVADPQYYLELLIAWSKAANVCRYIVVGAGVNYPVLLGPIVWSEQDGTNDVYAKIPLYEYRYLSEVVVETTQNSSRPSENSNQMVTAGSYTVEAGDSLWSICRRVYGDGSLADKLATANGISNPNLIYVGQVLKLLPGTGDFAAQSATVVPETEEGAAKVEETQEEAVAATRASIGLQHFQSLNEALFPNKLPNIGGV